MYCFIFYNNVQNYMLMILYIKNKEKYYSNFDYHKMHPHDFHSHVCVIFCC